MKKTLITAAAALILATPAYAANLDALLSEGQIIIEKEQSMSESMVAVCYDSDGRLIYADRINALENRFVLDLPENYGKIRVYDVGVNTYDVTVKEAPAQTPEATLHPAYEREVDAVSAFAVVENVSYTVNENSEECCAIACLYQGQEITVTVAEDTKIKSAPDAFSNLEGETAVSLKTGDVIYFATNPSRTKVTGMYLIYRPTDVFAEDSFYKCFSDSGKAGGLWSVVQYGAKAPSDRYSYAFGVVAQKYDNTLVLYSHSGLYDDAVEIDYTADTITYTCDMEGKPVFEISKAAGIKKSKISKSGIDEDDNITYSDDYTYSLALVRLVDDTASDIVVYQNVEF